MKNILKFLVKRIAMGLVTLWLVITITFFLIHMLPGDPFQSEKQIPPKVKEKILAKIHCQLKIHYVYRQSTSA